MKVLFLDIDGVLNTNALLRAANRYIEEAGLSPFEPLGAALMLRRDLVDRVYEVQRRTRCAVVLSSAWRRFFTMPELYRILDFIGTPLCLDGVTPCLGSLRGNEIQVWLDKNPEVEAFAIVDDRSNMGHLLPYLVQTDPEVGITDKEAEALVKLLGEQTPHRGGI